MRVWRSLVPFIRLFYGAQSTYLYYDADGGAHTVEQGEQGDPLMPGLYAVGVHGALLAANANLNSKKLMQATFSPAHHLTQGLRDRKFCLLMSLGL